MGVRVGEALAIRWSWWDQESQAIRLKQDPSYRLKFNRERQITVQPELAAILKRIRMNADGSEKAATERIVSPEVGGHCTATAGARFRAFLARCEIDRGGRSPHNVRHTWVSLMLASNYPTHAVMLAAGHTHLVTTQRYAHAVQVQAVAGWDGGIPATARDGSGEWWDQMVRRLEAGVSRPAD